MTTENKNHKMTRVHFAFIAEIIRENAASIVSAYEKQMWGYKSQEPYNPSSFQVVFMRNAIAEQFAEQLAKTNPMFNREKFLKACGFWEGSLE